MNKSRKRNKETEALYRKRYNEAHREELREKAKAYYQKNKPIIAEKTKTYRAEHRAERLSYSRAIGDRYIKTMNGRISRWKNNAKRRGISWSLDINDINSMPLICYYSGQDLVLEPNKPNTVSLDRIDSTKGYSRDNVVLCCGELNYMKQSLSQQRFIELCKMVSAKHST